MSEAMVKFAVETAHEAGAILRDYFGKIRVGTPKQDRGDVVTQADLESESLIIRKIREQYPEHRILAEEAGTIELDGAEYTWIIDPLDGTKNFVQHIPYFCVSMGLVCRNRPVGGVIYDPIHDEMFCGFEGGGSFLNGQPIRVSPLTDISVMLVNIAWGGHTYDGFDFKRCAVKIIEHTNYMRRLGAAALSLAYVASGRLDASVLPGIRPWDAAAGVLLVSEAGGKVTDMHGGVPDLSKQHVDVIAANPVLHEQMMKEIFVG